MTTKVVAPSSSSSSEESSSADEDDNQSTVAPIKNPPTKSSVDTSSSSEEEEEMEETFEERWQEIEKSKANGEEGVPSSTPSGSGAQLLGKDVAAEGSASAGSNNKQKGEQKPGAQESCETTAGEHKQRG